jgi:hypothetical protein
MSFFTPGFAPSQSLPFANPLAVRFDRLYTHYPPQTVSGPISFSVDAAGAIPGATSVIRLTANGADAPTFTGIKTFDGLTYDNRIGAVNYLQFTAIGWPGSLEYFVSYLQERNQILPFVLPGSPLLFPTRTAGITETAGTYSLPTAPWDQFMLAGLSLPANADGWVAVDNKSTKSDTVMLGFNTTSANQAYSNYEFFFWGFGNTYYRGTNGSGITNTTSATRRFSRLRRVSGVITAESSIDAITWDAVYTWPGSNQSQMFIQAGSSMAATGINFTHQGLT